MNKGIFYRIFFFNVVLLFLRMKNLLLILFALEFLILKIFLIFSYLNAPMEIRPSLSFLVVAAGEARIGLSLLVALVRKRGKDSGEGSSFFNSCEGY